MKGFVLSIVLLLVTVSVGLAAPPGFRNTPFHPNVDQIPRGVPARNFAPRNNFHHVPGANFNFNRNFGFGYGVPQANFGIGYGLNRNFGIGYNYGVPLAAIPRGYGYGVPAAAIPVGFAPSYGQGGCGQYFPGQAVAAPVYAPPVSYAPAYAAGGCGSYFPGQVGTNFNFGY